MYLSFFGLHEKPFAITPDPRYLFMSGRHTEALAHLLYGINEAGGFVQLTGEVGTGKTTIIRSLLAQTPKNAEIALILNPKLSASEFLLTICEELGIGVPDEAINSVKDLVDILSHYLLRAHSQGRRVVVVVDEAQNLAPEVLEQVRLLTNLETATQKLLQIILIGQPELRELLARVDLRQLAQRVTGRYHLDPLSSDETAAYIRHRLNVAGATNEIFTASALREVDRKSGGVPRLINIISDRALLGAYTQDRHHITPKLVRRAAAEVFGRRSRVEWAPIAIAAGVAALALLGWWVWQQQSASRTAAQAAAAAAAAATAAAQPAPAPAVVAAAPIAAPWLADLLRTFGTETDTDNAFNKLFALWGARYVASKIDPCTQAQPQGLECFAERGTLGRLQQFNRPAILSITDDLGRDHQVVLAGLNNERATLSLGGARREVTLGELSRLWAGDYVLLWRPGTGNVRPLSLGMRGAEVERLRDGLYKLRGEKAGRAADVTYDAELSRLVAAFQRQHRLTVDGVAGIETLVMLDAALADKGSPLLDRADESSKPLQTPPTASR